MTISLPENLAQRFARRVPAKDRSHYIARALEQKLSDEEKDLIRACEESNRDSDLKQLEKDFDALQDDIEEPWENPPPR